MMKLTKSGKPQMGNSESSSRISLRNLNGGMLWKKSVCAFRSAIVKILNLRVAWHCAVRSAQYTWKNQNLIPNAKRIRSNLAERSKDPLGFSMKSGSPCRDYTLAHLIKVKDIVQCV